MTDTAPKVSVVCAWYNRANYIRDTVDSLLAQDYTNFNITIVNDGSPDPHVLKILESYDDPRLRVIHQKNAGFTRAISRAINESDGELIAVQGAGDVSLPGRLSAQVRAFDTQDNISIVGSWFIKNDLSQNRNTLFRPTNLTQSPISLFAFSHGELMYDRYVYQKVGGYDESYTVGQGAPLWTSMLEQHEAVVVQKVLYIQRIFEDGVSRNVDAIQLRRQRDRERQFSEMKRRIEAHYGKTIFKKCSKPKPSSILQNIHASLLYYRLFGRMRSPIARKIWLRTTYSKRIKENQISNFQKNKP